MSNYLKVCDKINDVFTKYVINNNLTHSEALLLKEYTELLELELGNECNFLFRE